jgi:hypothetical protein
MKFRWAVSSVVLLLCSAATLYGQVLTPPDRLATPPPSPQPHAPVVDAPPTASPDRIAAALAARPRQELTLFADVLFGHDANAFSGLSGGGAPAEPLLAEPLLTTFAEGGLTYERIKGERSITLTGSGSTLVYENNLGTNPRASVDFTLTTPVGRANTLTATQRVGYDSLYSLGVYSPLADVTVSAEPPTPTSSDAILNRASWTSESGVELEREWSRRSRVSFSYYFAKRTFTDDVPGNSTGHNVSSSYTRVLGRTSSIVATYFYSRSEYVSGPIEGAFRPILDQGFEVGPRFTKRLSPSRSLDVSGGAGALYVSAESGAPPQGYAYWAPYGHLSVGIDLARTWNLTSYYRRGVTVLDGLTADAYLADALTISVGGGVGRRTELVFAAGLATGRVGAAAGVSEPNDYTTYSGAAQLGYELFHNLSAIVQYCYYHHNFSSTTSLPPDFPPQFGRNAVRAGLSVRVPMLDAQRRARR